eukprot:gene25792-biopygen12026
MAGRAWSSINLERQNFILSQDMLEQYRPATSNGWPNPVWGVLPGRIEAVQAPRADVSATHQPPISHHLVTTWSPLGHLLATLFDFGGDTGLPLIRGTLGGPAAVWPRCMPRKSSVRRGWHAVRTTLNLKQFGSSRHGPAAPAPGESRTHCCASHMRNTYVGLRPTQYIQNGQQTHGKWCWGKQTTLSGTLAADSPHVPPWPMVIPTLTAILDLILLIFWPCRGPEVPLLAFGRRPDSTRVNSTQQSGT